MTAGKKFMTTVFVLLTAACFAQAGALTGPKEPKILMVVTSHGSFDGSDKQTGLWLEEFAVPYRIFREAGYGVTVASPAGGKIPVDPRSMTTDTVLENAKEALDVLEDSVPLGEVSPKDYAAVFFPGGHGTMFDFPNNPPVQETVEYFLLQDRPTGLVCHGPAALVGATGKDGKPLVNGRRVAAFTDAEEKAVGLTDEVPFLLQSRLEALGADVLTAENFKVQVVVDGSLVTGQNPASSAKAAKEVLRLLKKESSNE